MFRPFLLLSLAAAIAGSFAGCKKDTLPPSCYTGRVVAVTCTDGMLIDVDPAYPIGAPAVLGRGRDTLVGRNVIAVANLLPDARLATLGRVLHFTYAIAPTYHNQLNCFAFDGSKTPIPRVVAINVSTTACDSIMP